MSHPKGLAILADIFRIQAFGQHEIDLQRAALPVAADRIAQHEIELGAIEGAVARIELEVQAGLLDG